MLDTLVKSAARLCEADMATINRQQGDAYRQVATYGHPPDFRAYVEANPFRRVAARLSAALSRRVKRSRLPTCSPIQTTR